MMALVADVSHSPITVIFLSAPSRNVLEEIRGKVGPVAEVTTAAELRRQGLIAWLLRRAFGPSQRMLVAYETAEGRAFEGPLELIAWISARGNAFRFLPDFSIEPIAIGRILAPLFRLAIASAREWILLPYRALTLKYLASRPRVVPRSFDPAGRVLYLKTDLWFGVKVGGSIGHIAGVANSMAEQVKEICFCWTERAPNLSPRVKDFLLPKFSDFCVPIALSAYCFHRHIVQFLRRAWPSAGGFDYIYQRMSLGNYTGVVLSRLFRVPLVLEYNGSEVWAARNWGNRPVRFEGLAIAAERVSLNHAHLVVTVSEALKADAVAKGVDPDRVVVYPNCIDPKVFDPDRFTAQDIAKLKTDLGFAAEDRLLTFVGTFGRWHGVTVLAEAIRKLFLENREFLEQKRARFVLVGDGPEMARVKAILSVPGLEDFVRVTGLVPQSEAPRYLAAAEVLLSPHVPNEDGSAFFGSPTKLFEYMAMGKVIVASDLEQVGEVLRDGDNSDRAYPLFSRAAILVKPGDSLSLVNGLLVALDLSREAASRLGEDSKALAHAKYTWAHHVKAILDRLARPTVTR